MTFTPPERGSGTLARSGRRAWSGRKEVTPATVDVAGVRTSTGTLRSRYDRALAARRDLGRLGRIRQLATRRYDELVADLADGPDHRLVLGTELGPQPPDVDVDRAGTAEVVVAPDLAQQLVAGEHPARVLGQELQQLELLVGEVERPALELRGVGVRVNGELAAADQPAGHGGGVGEPTQRQPEPGLGLRRSGAGQDHVVHAPVGVEGDQAGFGHDGQQGYAQSRRVQHPAG